MHPIERLRYVVRSGWAGPSALGSEAAWALADLGDAEAPALLPACRRLLERRPGCGPLWWVAAQVLSAGDPVAQAEQCAVALEEDPTADAVREAFDSGARVVRRGGMGEVVGADVVLIEIDALGATGMVAPASSRHLLEAARAAEVPVFLQSGVGRVLPPRLWEALERRLGARNPRRPDTAGAFRPMHEPGVHASRRGGEGSLCDHPGVETVIGPDGPVPLAVALAHWDCPEPPELLEET